MAHSSTMNSLTEALVSSFIPAGDNASRLRRAKDNFARRIKHHNFARTNQFEVAERLDGVEEKFQILNYDDLSDSLHMRLVELRSYEHNWLPDLLDLLLRLSNDPASRKNVELFQRAKERAELPPPLKWSEVEADDPIDRNDPIWKVQGYSDLSSDEDIEDIVSEPASPKTSRRTEQDVPASNATKAPFIPSNKPSDSLLIAKLREARFWDDSTDSVTITEQQAIRESLFMLQGLPTSLYRRSDSVIVPRSKYTLSHLSSEVLYQVLCAFADIGRLVDDVREWNKKPQQLHYLQAISASFQEHISDFDAAVSELQTQLINPQHSMVVSLANIFTWTEEKAEVLSAINRLMGRMASLQNNQVHYLDILFDEVCLSKSCDHRRSRPVRNILAVAWETYMKPIKKWVATGDIDPKLDVFFVQAGNRQKLSRLWGDWALLHDKSEDRRPPNFMQPFVQKIFSCGKTVLFLRTLTGSHRDRAVEEFSISLPGFRDQDNDFPDSVPFRETWSRAVDSALSSSLSHASQLLLTELGEKCKLWATLDALNHVYFAKCGPVTESIDSKMFSRIDKCDDGWNDRFLIADLLEEKFSGIVGIEMDRLVVHSRYTTSRSMDSRRQSVKILEEFSVEYVLPWQLANIISQSALGSYRRVALLLAQIRRGRYVLLRRAHFFVHNGLLHIDAGERKLAQALHYRLLLFVDVLYNHMTNLVIEQATTLVRQELMTSIDVDLMIASFDTFTTRLEDACLTAKKLRVVRDAVIGALDLCIRFSDVVSAPAADRSASDFEASSFISARSRRRGRKESNAAGDTSSDEENEDGGIEGYSSFVVLETGSPVDEIKKVRAQFERYLGFIVAGLRGLAKSRAQGESWEVLAERLDWRKGAMGQV